MATERKFSSLSSEALLKLAAKGNLSKEDATVVATILEKRFPTP